MSRLSALDASFLYNETDRAPTHVGSVQVLDPPRGPDTDYVERLKRYVSARLHLLPHLTRKLQFLPWGFDHPVWVRADSVDIDRHVQRVPAAAPGPGVSALEATIAKLHAERLDRGYPLWKTYVIEGLEDGRRALFQVVHHACLDGVAAQTALEAMSDPTEIPAYVAPPVPTAREPGVESHLLRSLELAIRLNLELPARAVAWYEGLQRLRQDAESEALFGAFAMPVPATPFNRAISSRRAFATARFAFDEMRALRKTGSYTLNDLFLAVCAGGLRRYLGRRQALPQTPLLAGVPVSTRQRNDVSMNNQVGMMMVSLQTQVADPLERLAGISASARRAKKVLAELGSGLPSDSVSPGLAYPAAAQVMEQLGIVPALPFNLVVSNVPGPRAWRYTNGAKMTTHFPVSIPAHGGGLNITAQSYVNSLDVGLTACAAAVPDLPLLRDDLVAAFAELKSQLQIPEFSPQPLQAAG